MTKDLTQPNGLAFSPDGKHFYVDDSERRNIRVYDVVGDGSLSNGRVFGDEPGTKEDGVPDGIKVDEKGNLYVTGPEGIWVWDAQGHHLGTIVIPEQPANLTWGDPDYGTLPSTSPLLLRYTGYEQRLTAFCHTCTKLWTARICMYCLRLIMGGPGLVVFARPGTSTDNHTGSPALLYVSLSFRFDV